MKYYKHILIGSIYKVQKYLGQTYISFFDRRDKEWVASSYLLKEFQEDRGNFTLITEVEAFVEIL